jgi:hypothetical protein
MLTRRALAALGSALTLLSIASSRARLQFDPSDERRYAAAALRWRRAWNGRDPGLVSLQTLGGLCTCCGHRWPGDRARHPMQKPQGMPIAYVPGWNSFWDGAQQETEARAAVAAMREIEEKMHRENEAIWAASPIAAAWAASARVKRSAAEMRLLLARSDRLRIERRRAELAL